MSVRAQIVERSVLGVSAVLMLVCFAAFSCEHKTRSEAMEGAWGLSDIAFAVPLAACAFMIAALFPRRATFALAALVAIFAWPYGNFMVFVRPYVGGPVWLALSLGFAAAVGGVVTSMHARAERKRALRSAIHTALARDPGQRSGPGVR